MNTLPALAAAAAELAIAEAQARTDAYARVTCAPSTRRQYAVDWSRFERWAAPLGLATLPTSPATVGLHLAWLADAGMKVSTIDQTVAAIGFYHRAAGFEWYPGHPDIARPLRGIRRTLGVAKQKKHAIAGAQLQAMVELLPPWGKGLQQRAAITVGWFGALRRSEVCAVLLEHVRFAHDERGREWLHVFLPKRKNDQLGRGSEIAICEQPRSSACPVATLHAWLELSQIDQGRIFRLKPQTLCKVVQRLMGKLGCDAKAFGAHSLRAGLITEAAGRGKTLDAIMRQSGHADVDVTMGYVRPATVRMGNVTDGLLGD